MAVVACWRRSQHEQDYSALVVAFAVLRFVCWIIGLVSCNSQVLNQQCYMRLCWWCLEVEKDGCGEERVGGNYMTVQHCWHVFGSSVCCRKWRQVSSRFLMIWRRVIVSMEVRSTAKMSCTENLTRLCGVVFEIYVWEQISLSHLDTQTRRLLLYSSHIPEPYGPCIYCTNRLYL